MNYDVIDDVSNDFVLWPVVTIVVHFQIFGIRFVNNVMSSFFLEVV